MKVNLVVTASGPNQGRAIPIPGAKFLIGRDPHCQLRPASQAVSKQHCAIHIRDGRVIIEDFGSTNGTLVNDEPVQGERPVNDGDKVKVGPLEFMVQIVPMPTPADGTPLPERLKAPDSGTTAQLRGAAGQPPAPKKGASTPAVKPASAAMKPAPPPKPVAPQPAPAAPAAGGDDAAAMLLSMEDDTPSGEQPAIPGGSTVMEIPAVDSAGRLIEPKKEEKKESVDSSSSASELLKKYFRRSS